MESTTASLNTSIKNGLDILRQAITSLGQDSGVYRMIDAKDQVLYVGKAKHLKNRVSNYVNIGALPARLQRMVMHTAKIEFIVTRSEAEALLVEANLIKQYKPRYNILLKDDKSYPYIHFSGDHAYPRISKYRGTQDKNGTYLGPFVSAFAVDDMLKILQKTFLLRPCADSIFKHRTRPCLQYQIKRCSAPCVGFISEQNYAKNIHNAQQFLKGNANEIREMMRLEMQQLSNDMQFEKAAEMRDRLKALTSIQQQQSLAMATLKNADILVLVREREMVCVQLFSYRYGSNFGNHSFFPANAEDMSDAAILEAFIGRYYQRQPTPEQLIMSHELEDGNVVEEALKLCGGHAVEIIVPKRGEKLEALKLALANTQDSLTRHIADQEIKSELLEHMAHVFQLPEPPKRIEVYDNSHISGTNAVGAMVVATPDGFDKKSYRVFNIKTADLKAGDDYGMLREVLTRRLKRILTEEGQEQRPDLLLIDGGAGQLSVALEVCEQLGISDLPLVAIAKGEDRNAGREWFHLPNQQAFQLPVGDPLLHYLQRLRDEVHRFAIGTHRNKRSKSLVRSELDGLTGIGPKRKKALLTHFGSVRALSGASMSEISKVEGISSKVAEDIHRYFH